MTKPVGNSDDYSGGEEVSAVQPTAFTCKPGPNQINPDRTGLRLGTERHWSARIERQRLCKAQHLFCSWPATLVLCGPWIHAILITRHHQLSCEAKQNVIGGLLRLRVTRGP